MKHIVHIGHTICGKLACSRPQLFQRLKRTSAQGQKLSHTPRGVAQRTQVNCAQRHIRTFSSTTARVPMHHGAVNPGTHAHLLCPRPVEHALHSMHCLCTAHAAST